MTNLTDVDKFDHVDHTVYLLIPRQHQSATRWFIMHRGRIAMILTFRTLQVSVVTRQKLTVGSWCILFQSVQPRGNSFLFAIYMYKVRKRLELWYYFWSSQNSSKSEQHPVHYLQIKQEKSSRMLLLPDEHTVLEEEESVASARGKLILPFLSVTKSAPCIHQLFPPDEMKQLDVSSQDIPKSWCQRITVLCRLSFMLCIRISR